MEFGLLGPLLITRDGQPVEVGAPKQRILLIHLLLRAGETVALDRLIDGLWGEDPPPQARVTLRSYVSHLRRTLEGPDGRQVIVTRGSGYGLDVAPESVDAVRFERLVAAAREHLAAGAAETALRGLDDALGLWRGEALADVAGSDLARGERARLEELRLVAHEDRFDALLALGRHREAVAALEAFTAAEAFRERPHAQLMLALYRSGRAPDALTVFQRFRETLVEELGLDPSPQLADLVERVLQQSADLDLPAVSAQPAHTVAAASPPAGRLVGRTHELAELDTLVGRLLAGEGGLLLVAGEPGIGKTALLGALDRLAAEAGASVFWGRCHETAGAPAFWPWVQVLRAIAGGCSDEELRDLAAGSAGPVTQLVDDIAVRLGEQQVVLGEELESARFQLYDAIATFLLRASHQQPVVLLLDDLHWADTPTLQTLAFLTPLLGRDRLLIAGSYRDVRADWAEELEATLAAVVREPATEQLGLAGLQPAALAEITEGLGGEPLSAAELSLLHTRTRGNPFFVRQLSQLRGEAGGDGEQIPTGVRHVIARRLSLLPVDVRGLLEAASVLGAQFSLRSLAAATAIPISALRDAVEHAAAHGLLEPIGRPVTGYRFVHALVRETIYDSLSPHTAARLHAQVGEALEATPHPAVAELAEHFWQAAELVDDDRPVRYLTAAADEALQLLAYELAETSLRRALAVLAQRGGDPTAELQVRVRLVRLLAGIHGWAAEAVKEVAAPAVALARQAGFGPDVVSLWMAVVLGCIARGDLHTADELVEELLAEALAGAPPHPAALAAGHAAVAYMAVILGRDPGAALAHAHEAQRHAAVADADHLEGATHHLQVTALNMEALALAYQGESAAAIEAGRRAIALAADVAGPLPQAVAWMTGASVGVLVDEPAFTAEAAGAGLALCERYSLSFTGHMLTTLDGWARARLDEDAADQLARMVEAVEALGRFGHAYRANFLLFTAETALLAGDLAAARRWLDEAGALAASTGEFLQPARLGRLEAALTGAALAQP